MAARLRRGGVAPTSSRVTGSVYGSVIVWDLSDRTQPRRLGAPLTVDADGVSSVAFSPEQVMREEVPFDLDDRSQGQSWAGAR